MRGLRLGLIFAGLSGVVLAAALHWFSRQDRLLAAVDWALERYTDFRLVLIAPKIALGKGHASADELHLLPPQGPPLLSLYDLQVSSGLGELVSLNLHSSRLRASALVLHVAQNGVETHAGSEPGNLLQWLGLMPAQLTLDKAHIVLDGRQPIILPVSGIDGRREGPADYRLQATALYDGDPMHGQLRLIDVLQQDDKTDVSLELSLDAPDSASQVQLVGTLSGDDRHLSYVLQADSHYRDFATFLKGMGAPPQVAGQLSVAARISGDLSGFDMENIDAVLDHGSAYRFSVQGQVQYQFDGHSAVALSADGELASVERFLSWLNLEAANFGRATAELTLSGSLQQPVVDAFTLTTANAEGLAISLSGALPSPLQPNLTAGENRVRLRASGPQLAVLSPWIGQTAVDPGPWQASLSLREAGPVMTLNDIQLRAGEPDALLVTAEGSVGDIAGVVERQLAGIEGVALDVVLTSRESGLLADLSGLPQLRGHHLQGRLELSGSGERLVSRGGQVELEGSDLAIRASSLELELAPASEQPLVQLAARLELELSDTGALSQYLPVHAPVLGPLRASADLRGSGDILSITDLQARVVGDQMRWEARGRVDDAAALGGVVIDNMFQGIATADLLALAGGDFHYPGDLGRLEGSFTVMAQEGAWQLQSLEVASSEPGGPLEIAAKGSVRKLLSAPRADLDLRFHLRDPALLEQLTGLRMSPAQGRARVAAGPDRVEIDTRGRVGESELEAEADLNFVGDSPASLETSLYSPAVFLRDFGLQADSETGPAGYRPADSIRTPEDPPDLEAVLRALPALPMRAELRIDQLSGRETRLKDILLQYDSDGTRHTLRPVALSSGAARAELMATVDRHRSPADISISGEAFGIPIGMIVRDLGIAPDFAGTLSLSTGLTSAGTTPEELLTSLDGALAFAVEDAVIVGGAYDKMATDLLGWIYSGAALEDSTHVDCAMADLSLASGVAESNTLYLETEHLWASGTARIDLPAQTLDINLTPLSKSRALQIPSAVSLKGPFSDPQPEISAVSAAIDAYSAWLTLVPQFTLELFGYRGETGKQHRPCQPLD